jgi:hypothetical protein
VALPRVTGVVEQSSEEVEERERKGEGGKRKKSFQNAGATDRVA